MLTLTSRYLFENGECVGTIAQLTMGATPLTAWVGQAELREIGHRLAALNGTQLQHIQLSSVELVPLAAPPESPPNSVDFDPETPF